MDTIRKAGILTFIFLISFAVVVLLLTSYITNPKGFTGRFSNIEDETFNVFSKIGDSIESATNKTSSSMTEYSKEIKQESREDKAFSFFYIPLVGFILIAIISVLIYLFFKKM